MEHYEFITYCKAYTYRKPNTFTEARWQKPRLVKSSTLNYIQQSSMWLYAFQPQERALPAATRTIAATWCLRVLTRAFTGLKEGSGLVARCRWHAIRVASASRVAMGRCPYARLANGVHYPWSNVSIHLIMLARKATRRMCIFRYNFDGL